MVEQETVFILIKNSNLIIMKQILLGKGKKYPTFIDEEYGLLKLIKTTNKGSAIYQFVQNE